MNKISKYTHFVLYKKRTFLFHVRTGAAFILDPQLVSLIIRNKENIDAIQCIHPDLYATMLHYGMIVEDACDEADLLIREWLQADAMTDSFFITINPTLNCNLSCWYCYEKHEQGTELNGNVIPSIKNLISRKMEKGVKNLSVSFFGGEPLLQFHQSVFPLLQFACKKGLQNNVRVASAFTTNGVLLTEDVLERLNSVGLSTPTTFQMTLDGNRKIHNSIRYGKDKTPTYDIILQNVHNALRCGNRVGLRFNYTKDNLYSFIEVMDDLSDLSPEELSRFTISFQQVWQDKISHKDLRNEARALAVRFKENGFNTDSDLMFTRHVCYADSPNNVVINYNGDIFKCTARDFVSSRREGVLNSDGDILWNEKFHERMDIRYNNEACRNCNILPLCNGGCSQSKLESRDKGCYFKYGNKEKLNIVTKRLEEILSAPEERIKAPSYVPNTSAPTIEE
jgi:uncharacterized protein